MRSHIRYVRVDWILSAFESKWIRSIIVWILNCNDCTGENRQIDEKVTIFAPKVFHCEMFFEGGLVNNSGKWETKRIKIHFKKEIRSPKGQFTKAQYSKRSVYKRSDLQKASFQKVSFQEVSYLSGQFSKRSIFLKVSFHKASFQKGQRSTRSEFRRSEIPKAIYPKGQNTKSSLVQKVRFPQVSFPKSTFQKGQFSISPINNLVFFGDLCST